jgi:hypothetical protein
MSGSANICCVVRVVRPGKSTSYCLSESLPFVPVGVNSSSRLMV